uniref:Protein kinase domain-containing protein n=2 Tax=Macrostomum lignano TaxID=282301 RepID=A0A1I8G800_9PLAT
MRRQLVANMPILQFDDPLERPAGTLLSSASGRTLDDNATFALATPGSAESSASVDPTSAVSIRHQGDGKIDQDNYRLLTLCSVAIKHICRLSSSNDYEADVKFQTVFRMLRANGILRWKTKAMKNFLTVNPLFESAFARLFEQTTVGVLSSQCSIVIPKLNCDDVPRRLSLDNTPNWYQSNFEEQARLGSGAFGVVHRAKNLTDGGLYAIKKIRLRRLDLTELHRVHREVATLCRLDHRNIVRYHASWTEILPKGAAFGARVTSLSESEREARGDSLPSETSSSSTSTSISSSKSSSATNSAKMEQSDSMIVFRNDEAEEKSRMKDAGKPLGNYQDSEACLSGEEQFDKDLSLKTGTSAINWQLRSNGGWTAELAERWQQLGSDSELASAPVPSYRRVLSLEEASSSAIDGNHRNGGNARRPASKKRHHQLMPLSHRAPLNRMMTLRSSELVLFIQMQLCDTNLQAHLDRRNSTSAPTGPVIDDYENHDIFHQLLRGIEYIHGQGILHRDLKCTNVFLQLVESPETTKCRYRVRIGDFGLARSVASPADPRRADAPRLKMSTVGTASYQSPELRAGLQYDQKTDMFSLGVILFELYQPFSSGHERQRLLNELRREHRLPDDLALRYPQEADVILKLTHPDPARRPQAAELLQSWRYAASKSAAVDRLAAEVLTLRRLLAEETKRRKNAERKLVKYAINNNNNNNGSSNDKDCSDNDCNEMPDL